MAFRTESMKPFRGAVRLVFAYERDRVRLVERQSIDMIAPPGEPEPLPERAAGFWVELRDGRGRRLYQRVIQQPVRFEVEVFPEKLDDRIEWRPLASPQGTFAP